jgi:uncharacterized protein Yka (UPF0111/DUF47 family)
VKRSLRDAARDLLGRSGGIVAERMQQQVTVLSRAVDAVRDQCASGHADARALERIERDGDEQRAALTRLVSSSLTTPVDREDLFRLSRSIDDVLDNLRDFARELELYSPADPGMFVPLLDTVEDAVRALFTAVGALAGKPAEIVDAARDADHAASQVRRGYEDAIAKLLEEAENPSSLRQRELLRRLDVVGLRLGEAVNALADGGIKRLE